ncbi:hypothetical protein AB4510_18630 [Vibrio sp. 10N.222.54.B12]|uniref:hypothetical protein n=1 Tax=Vibrio sp. 10N.222.54.B12 TaxID=3229636 RepID=UPI00354FB3B7
MDNNLLYGEYCSNNERRAVSIYSFDGFSQNELVKIHGVRHVHGVFYDDFDDLVYITTGDSDEESRIYCLNGGKLTLVHGGSQQARAVQLLFDEKYIYYGTDTPNAQNNIYKLCKKSYTSYCLGTVHSSIFYGVSLGRDMYFGSVAEPSQLNCTERVEVYKVSCDKLTLEFSSRKDMYHMKLFQYGQVKFPIYDKRVADNLYFYCVGTVNDGGYSIKKCFKN